MTNETVGTIERDTSRTPVNARKSPAETADDTPLQPGAAPEAVTDETIRARAYQLWEQAGRPDGDGTEFWFRAQQDLRAPGMR